MNIHKRLERILDYYINQNKKLVSEYEQRKNKQATYESLLELLQGSTEEILNNKQLILVFLNGLYLDSIYIDEFNGIISSKPSEINIQKFTLKIIQEYQEFKEELEYLELEVQENEELKESAQRVKSSLKYRKLITQPHKDIPNVKTILEKLEKEQIITPQDEILYINEIEQHNERITAKQDIPEEQTYSEDDYNEIPNIITAGFQTYDAIEVSSSIKNKLDTFATEIIESISECNEEQIISLLLSYKNYNLETNEYNYILLKILEDYTDELLTLYKLLIDKTVYRDKSNRTEIIRGYYNVLNKYLIIQKYYESEVAYVPEENDEETQKIDHTTKKRFIYCHLNANTSKSRLISDMTNIPYEYYDTVRDLLTKFKNGTIGTKEFKALTNHKKYKGYLELRYDQVRIVLKHMKNDIYVILGVFAKKANNDMTMYSRIINRILPEIDTDSKLSIKLELADQTEAELEELVKTKGRKGTR